MSRFFSAEEYEQGRLCSAFGFSAGDANTLSSGNTSSATNTNTLSTGGTQALSTGASTSDSSGKSETVTDGTSNSNSTTANYTANYETGGSTSVNSNDPGVVANLKALVSSALANADNATSNTSDVVKGIFQSAQDSFASVFGQRGGAGLYNDSATAVQEDNTLARATADASSAVLNYQTSQEGIAETGLQNLLSALGTNTSNTGTSTFGTNVSYITGSTTTQSIADTISNLLTTGTSSNTTDTTSKNNTTVTGKATQASSGESNTATAGVKTIICTELLSTGHLEARQYVTVHKHYVREYSDEGKAAYLFVARPLVRKLRRDRTSKVSRAIVSIILGRTKYVCNRETGIPVLSFSEKLFGFFALKLVWAICFPVGLWFVFRNRLLKNWAAPESFKKPKKGVT